MLPVERLPPPSEREPLQQDKNFIKDAAESGRAEAELSKVAEKSQNPEVKRFAGRMVRDHTAANTELTRIATALGIETPKRFDTEHQRIRDQLASMHDGAFDQQYIHVMVNDHDQTVKLFRGEAIGPVTSTLHISGLLKAAMSASFLVIRKRPK
jgi:putative membrane protein